MGLITIINLLFWIVYALLWARIILSFVRPDPYHPTWGPIVRAIYDLTEPILGPVRRLLPPMAGLDFSPLIVFLLLRLLQGVVINLVA
jgi:YggT family protein